MFLSISPITLQEYPSRPRSLYPPIIGVLWGVRNGTSSHFTLSFFLLRDSDVSFPTRSPKQNPKTCLLFGAPFCWPCHRQGLFILDIQTTMTPVCCHTCLLSHSHVNRWAWAFNQSSLNRPRVTTLTSWFRSFVFEQSFWFYMHLFLLYTHLPISSSSPGSHDLSAQQKFPFPS